MTETCAKTHDGKVVSVVPAAPVLGVQSPANLRAGRERSLKAWDGKANESSEGRDPRNFYRPKSKPVLLEMSLDPVCPRVALVPRQCARKKLHDPLIAVQHCKRWSVAR